MECAIFRGDETILSCIKMERVFGAGVIFIEILLLSIPFDCLLLPFVTPTANSPRTNQITVVPVERMRFETLYDTHAINPIPWD